MSKSSSTKHWRTVIISIFLIIAAIIVSIYTPIEANAAPYTEENANWNTNLNPDGSDPSRYFGDRPSHSYYASPADWRDIAIYQVLTDRYSDGNPENNDLRDDFDVKDIFKRHGGDFNGLANKLRYIKSVGFNAVWVSPVVKNQQSNSYHGFSPIDFTVLDERFGTLAEFQAFVDLAHDMGIYVIVDTVVNHMADYYYFDGYEAGSAPFALHEGEYPLVLRDASKFYEDFAAENTFVEAGSYLPVYDESGALVEDVGAGSYFNSDFHHNGSLSDYADPWQVAFGKFVGVLDDLRVEEAHVQDKMIAMTKAFIASTDVDALRVDAARFVHRDFLESWSTEVRDHASTLGKENFFIFGELWSPRELSATFVGRGKTPEQYGNNSAFISSQRALDAGLNFQYVGYGASFPVESVIERFKENKPFSLGEFLEIYQADLLAYDLTHPLSGENRYRQVNFASNHDLIRISLNDDDIRKRHFMNAFVATWPGIPVLYFGDEQSLKTNVEIPEWSRESFMTSLAWKELHDNGIPNKASRDNFNYTASGVSSLRSVLAARSKYPSLRYGENVVSHFLSDDGAIFAFSRTNDTADDAVLVIANASGQPYTFNTEPTNSLNTPWSLGYTATMVNTAVSEERYAVSDTGQTSSPIEIGAYEVKTFVLSDRWQMPNPVVISSSPNHDDATRSIRPLVTVTFDSAMNETSLFENVRFNGDPLPASVLSYDAATFTLEANITLNHGINYFAILEDARAETFLNLKGGFELRLRFGNGDNILINNAASYDPSLITVIDSATGDIQLNHKAYGAEKYRVSNDYGQTWSSWADFDITSDWNIGTATGKKVVIVQYYADGSSAYFVSSSIDGEDTLEQTVPSIYVRGSHNQWSTSTPMTLVDNATWQINLGFFGSEPQFKFDILGDWSWNYGDFNQTGNAGIVEYDSSPINIESNGWYKITFNEVLRTYLIEEGEAQGFESLHLRGSFNNWAALPMTLNGVTWETHAVFPENTIFKFDVFGDWIENYGDTEADGIADANGNDISTPIAGFYKVYFNHVTFEYSTELLNYDTVSIPGTFNGWSLESTMVTEANGLFSLDIWAPWHSDQAFKFVGNADWANNFGDNEVDGIADFEGADIALTQGFGAYTVSFDETTLAYTVVKTPNYETMYLRGTFNSWGTTPFTKVDDQTWEITVDLPSGDQLLKFDPIGDWSGEVFGDNNQDGNLEINGNDIVVNSNGGQYLIIFNDALLTYSITPADNQPPTVTITPDEATVGLNELISFAADANDPEGAELSFEWSNGSTGESATYSFSDPGTYTISVTVEDDQGLTASATAIVIVENQPPTLNINTDKLFAPHNEQVTLSAIVSDDGTVETYLWSTGETTNLISVGFDGPGEKTIELTVTDNHGATASDSVTITATNSAPVLEIEPTDVTVTQGETASFSVAALDPENDEIALEWSNGSVGETVSYTFNTVGEFEISVTATDEFGASISATALVTVVPPSSNYPAMYLVGSFNGWTLQDVEMQLIAENTWDILIPLAANDQYKFVPANWSLSFGDRNQDGIADSNGGGNIQLTQGAGPYRIRFNDETLVHSAEIEYSPQPPIADAGQDLTVKTGEIAQLSGGGSTDVNNDIVSYEWDNGFGTGIDVSRVMDTEGTFTVTLTVTDAAGHTATDSVTITVVNNTPPTADAGDDLEGYIDTPVQLSALGSVDPDGEIVDYQWSNGLNGATPYATFSSAGSYEVTLTVTDNNGAIATDTVTITISAAPPLSNFPSMHLVGSFNGWNTSATPMTLVSDHTWQIEIELNNSDQFKFVPHNWSLSFGDRNLDGIADTLGGGNIPTSQGSGIYTITFNDQTRVYEANVYVGPQPPVANAGLDQTVRVGTTVTLDGSSSSDDNNAIAQYLWNEGFGEGQIVSKQMDSVGSFTVTLTVVDEDGLTDEDSVLITVVDNFKPTAKISYENNDWFVGDTIVFSGDTSLDSDGSIVSWLWNGNTSGSSFSMPLTAPGPTTITLQVTDNDGATDTTSITINVQNLVSFATANFECRNGYTYFGQNIYVVGNIAELGNWNPANAVKLNPNNYPTWSNTIQQLPTNTAIEWKCIKKNNSGNVVWQSGGNNSLQIGNAGEYNTIGNF